MDPHDRVTKAIGFSNVALALAQEHRQIRQLQSALADHIARAGQLVDKFAALVKQEMDEAKAALEAERGDAA